MVLTNKLPFLHHHLRKHPLMRWLVICLKKTPQTFLKERASVPLFSKPNPWDKDTSKMFIAKLYTETLFSSICLRYYYPKSAKQQFVKTGTVSFSVHVIRGTCNYNYNQFGIMVENYRYNNRYQLPKPPKPPHCLTCRQSTWHFGAKAATCLHLYRRGQLPICVENIWYWK